jgi:hypothetical protein
MRHSSGRRNAVLCQEDAIKAMDEALDNLRDSIKEAKNEDGGPLDETEKRTYLNDLDGFCKLFRSFLPQRGYVIDWNKIQPPSEGMIVPHADLVVRSKRNVAHRQFV